MTGVSVLGVLAGSLMYAELCAGEAAVQIAPGMVSLNFVSDAVKKQIEALPNHRERTIYFDKSSGNSEFATIRLLPWTQKLSLIDTKITDLTPLATLSNLVSFGINRVSTTNRNWRLDVSPLASCQPLRSLSLSSVEVCQESALDKLVNLTSLDLHMVNTVNLSCVAHMPNLESLHLYACKGVTTLQPLRGFGKVRRIYLYMLDVPAGDYEVLASLPALEWADLSFAPIRDLQCVAGLAKLRELAVCWGRSLESLKGIETLTALETLTLTETKVSDLSPLAQARNLARISIGGTAITDIRPLMDLPRLTSLRLPTSVPKDQVEALKAKLPKCSVDLRD